MPTVLENELLPGFTEALGQLDLVHLGDLSSECHVPNTSCLFEMLNTEVSPVRKAMRRRMVRCGVAVTNIIQLLVNQLREHV